MFNQITLVIWFQIVRFNYGNSLNLKTGIALDKGSCFLCSLKDKPLFEGFINLLTTWTLLYLLYLDAEYYFWTVDNLELSDVLTFMLGRLLKTLVISVVHPLFGAPDFMNCTFSFSYLRILQVNQWLFVLQKFICLPWCVFIN